MFQHRLLRRSLFLVVATLAACSSGDGTQVDVTIAVDSSLLPTPVNSITGSISATGRQTVMVDLPAVSTQTWQIKPQNIPSAGLQALITVTGQTKTDGGQATTVVTSEALIEIKPGVHQTVPIQLSRQCQNVTCPQDQTCSAGLCVPIPQVGSDGGVATGGHVGTGGGSGGSAGGHGGSAGAGGAAGAAGGRGGQAGAGTGGGAGSGTGGSAGAPGTGGSAGAGGRGGAGGSAGQGGMGGKPKLSPGDACTSTSDCASGVCSSADHVCCDSDCTGTCVSCVGSKTGKTNGVCSNLPAGSNADSDCSVGSTTCGTTGSCDGAGKCAVAAATTPCTGSTSCTGSTLTTTPAACDGKGACVPGTAMMAACPGGVTCMSATACLPSSCTVDGNCTSGTYCDTGTHTCTAKKDLGGSCSGTNQCTSGFCADGVCCSNACNGTCEACLQTKTGVANGHCAAVTSGTDPDSECAADSTTCGHTGLCDHNGGSGGGACAYTTSGTTCAGTFSCTGSGVTSSTNGSCDGAGTCKQGAATPGTCSGYTCASASACNMSCASSSGCISGYSCVSGQCALSKFTTGPCVTSPDFGTTTLMFALGSDGKIHGKTGSGAWTTLSLDASGVDTRSDLDCSANSTVTHITATGTNPLGVFLHATGSGTTFNPFFKELTTESFSPPGASIIAYPSGNNYVIGALDSIPSVYDVQGSTYTSLQPITTYSTVINTTIDVSQQGGGGGSARMVVGFDTNGKLDLYTNYISSAPMMWVAPLILSPPSGTSFQYSPSVCVDTGAMGGIQVHLVAVASGSVYDSYSTSGAQGSFSAWQKAGTGAAAAVDCTMMADESLHIVTLNSAGHVLDIHGSPGSWSTTDLGVF